MSTNPQEKHFELNNEAATVVANRSLKNSTCVELQGVTVYSGTHKKHGSVHIVIPATGKALFLLPFEVQRE